MSKKNKWWKLNVWTPIEQKKNEQLFSNTIAKHNRKFDQDGIEILDEDDLTYHDYHSYDYGWDRKLTRREEKGTRQELMAQTSMDFGNTYKEYNRTGIWRGYTSYREPQLSYKYVEQMANSLSASHNINVQVGNDWEVDLLNKKLTYNPASLIYGTKSELLATLMHEIGKLRYMEHSSLLHDPYIHTYGLPATEVLACFEDVRVDYHMLMAYESAGEIYESAMPSVEKQAKKYIKMGIDFRASLAEAIKKSITEVQKSENSNENFMKNFGVNNLQEAVAQTQLAIDDIDKAGTIYDYCADMLRGMYDLDTFGNIQKEYPDLKEKIDLTIDAIEPAKKFKTSKELTNHLDTQVYPHIENLLKDFSDGNEKIKKHLPQMSDQQMEKILQMALMMMNNQGQVSTDEKGMSISRSSGPSDNNIPPEWKNGEYQPLKDSVLNEIRELVNRLTFLRREEMIAKYQGDQKRGKLNSKKLYKSAFGSPRLFKQRLENVDTVQSFAFSVLIDISGSMGGSRIIHSTRALIIFAEVFKKLDIPFELVAFGDGAKHVKQFEDELTKEIQKKIGGLITNLDGSTNLNRGLDKLKIHNRPERNKVVICITDGGVGNVKDFDTRYFIPWEKKGIKSLGIGIECEAQMKYLCQGNSKVMKNANEMPNEFVSIIKTLIQKK